MDMCFHAKAQRRKGRKGGVDTLGLNREPILLYYSPEPSCANDPVVLAL
jgi:hypothetical protein